MIYKKKLGLDLGSKSLGIAISDGLNIIAHGSENFFYKDNDLNICLTKVKEYINKENIDEIILGYPLYPSGDKSASTLLVERFKKILNDNIDIKVILYNESYSTIMANHYMLNANLSRKKRKSKKDMISAQIILQQYLDKLLG